MSDATTEFAQTLAVIGNAGGPLARAVAASRSTLATFEAVRSGLVIEVPVVVDTFRANAIIIGRASSELAASAGAFAVADTFREFHSAAAAFCAALEDFPASQWLCATALFAVLKANLAVIDAAANGFRALL
eukprot:CAMPEP_0174875326 /NCGR_PEP_ID=MMETSP1114-20130205/78175_1 /TAXON_ID=312471 /ORGANISM="Neobodo designis, Strain CCAP 1951/1" /LENGTH=131 /DNA_ID=CAMNT_0016110673 /DNA_START=61 /DNA_END=452 /DNA_ORIENTATION=+